MSGLTSAATLGKIFLQLTGVQRGGHDGEFQVRAMLFLQIECAGQRDVAVKMAFVKFVENEDGHAVQLRVLNHLPQQNAFGHKPDFGFGRRDIFEADLVTDLLAKFHVQFLGDARREQPGRQPARLKNHHLAVPQEIVPEQHLRHLRGFTGAGGRGQNQPPVGFQPGDEIAFDVVDGQTVGHVPPIVTGRMSLTPRKIRECSLSCRACGSSESAHPSSVAVLRRVDSADATTQARKAPKNQAAGALLGAR